MGTKERLLSGEYQPDTYLLYETRQNVCCNVRIVIKVKENVDGNLLYTAVNRAIKQILDALKDLPAFYTLLLTEQ